MSSKLTDRVLVILLGLSAFFSIWSCSRYNDLEAEVQILEHNQRALTDTLSLTRLENQSLLASRLSMIQEKDAALRDLGLSRAEYKDLESKLNNKIERIARVQTQIIRDTIYLTPTQKTDTIIVFRLLDPYMKAQLTYLRDTESLRLDSLSIPLDLTIGYTKDFRFFLNTDNPYLKITEVKSSLISEETPLTKRRALQDRLSFGLNMGPGFYYSLTGKGPDIGFGVSVGLNLRF